MFNIILYFIIFCIIIYFIFQGLVNLSSSLFLIDEHFLDRIKDFNDRISQNFKNSSSEIENNKKLNTHLRYDFFISLALGIIWFIFPILLFQFRKSELAYMSPDTPYLGQFLAIVTLLTCIIPIKTLKKPNKDKKLVLGTKLFCALSILIIQFIFIYYLQRINYFSIVTLILISIWMSNSVLGLSVSLVNSDFN